MIEKMRLNDKGSPSRRASSRSSTRTLVLALGQDTDLSLLEPASDITTTDGVIERPPDHDDRRRRIFAGGDAVPRNGRRPSRSATESGPHAASTPSSPAAASPIRPARARRRSNLNTWYYADADGHSAPTLDRARADNFDEVVVGLTEDERALRGPPVHLLRQLLRVRQLLRGVSGQRSHQAAEGDRYEIDYDFCKGCGICVQECPCGAIEMVPSRSSESTSIARFSHS